MKKLFLKVAVILIFITSVAFITDSDPEGLKKGDKAPEINTKDTKGKKIELKAMLAKGEVVVIFYRGFWCPYCNKQLSNLQDSLKMITAKGASVIAITPEIDKNIEKTLQKTKVAFPIIHDKNNEIMKAYKVNYQVNTETLQKLKEYGINLNENNGENGSTLPVPAVYIIDKSGNIKYSYFNPDYRKRASVADILNNL